MRTCRAAELRANTSVAASLAAPFDDIWRHSHLRVATQLPKLHGSPWCIVTGLLFLILPVLVLSILARIGLGTRFTMLCSGWVLYHLESLATPRRCDWKPPQQ
mmetsp:Transcript_122738/g.393107  ORF Transcript_122738/g.393107 Transcript_122738/m.393107 type:complete len:103 (-) Transcript_122738:22-330(-)